ncbi:hypothetical protein H206_05504 [Candidatus Electrothrix aarhusensis]|uniref:Uncharacterized protein n=1 Tax=Candidatus Electrothrix aarhusensis TaxID=1859131 RepID=A0A3S3SQN0_9BACT|nr:hypothetical protein H206_05504 [Candidatus Electrothrix aarhusensis]
MFLKGTLVGMWSGGGFGCGVGLRLWRGGNWGFC